MREVTIFSVGKEYQCVTGDYMEFNTYSDDFIHCNNYADPLVSMDATFKRQSAPIERISYRTPFSQHDEFICIDPKDREKILTMVERSEINRLEVSKRGLESMLHKRYKKDK